MWLILGLGLAFLLRLPSLFEPYSYGDECIYLTLGQAVQQGLVLYRQIHDNKPPLLYLLAALSGNLFWFRALLLFWGLATIFLFYKLAQIFFQKEEKLIKISTLSFVFFSSIPLFEGGVANAEVFLILFTIAGILRIFCGEKQSKWVFFSAGIFFSLATLFKVPAIFDFAAVLVFLVFFLTNRKKFKLYILNSTFLLLGFLLPILASFAYFLSQGALSQYLTAAFFQNLPYLSSWGNSPRLRFGLLVFFVGLALWKRKEIGNSLLFVLVWFAFSLFGATLSGRPYPHYLVQSLPSLCLLLAFFFSKLKTKEHLFLSASLAIFLLALFYFRFWIYSPFSPYKNFLLFATKRYSQEKYFSYFGQKVGRDYQLAQFLTLHTQKNEKVFIWGDSPCIYALSRRLPVGRYTVAYHIIDFGGFGETASVLGKEKPRFIIDLQDETKPFPKLREILARDYSLFKIIDGAKIFRLSSLKMI